VTRTQVRRSAGVLQRNPRDVLKVAAFTLIALFAMSLFPTAAKADANTTLYNSYSSVINVRVLLVNQYTLHQSYITAHLGTTVGNGAGGSATTQSAQSFYLPAGYCSRNYVNGVRQAVDTVGPKVQKLGSMYGNNWSIFIRRC
jgi:hypothetical protein